jgi:hypothetical protein
LEQKNKSIIRKNFKRRLNKKMREHNRRGMLKYEYQKRWGEKEIHGIRGRK